MLSKSTLRFAVAVVVFSVGIAAISVDLASAQSAEMQCTGAATGCFDTYSCTSSTYECPSGTAASKRGLKLSHKYCATGTGVCNVISVVCFRETQYTDDDCDEACAVLYNYADGCKAPGLP